MLNSIENLTSQQFTWFTGVVEDVNDPEQMGRVRVRCIGFHSEDKTEISTESLPWAVVMTPIQSASMSGIGQSATGVLPGSWVVGFFRDGRSAQDPIVLGTIPSYSTKRNKENGFADPSGTYPLRDGIDTPVEAKSDYTTTEAYRRRQVLAKAVPVASPPSMHTGTLYDSGEGDDYGWVTPSIEDKVKPVYPNNQVTHSVAGHVQEIDNTTGAERILQQHKSGTFEEVYADGTKNTTIVGDNYKVILKSDHIVIEGDCFVTINGNSSTYVKGNHILEVDGDLIENIHGNKYTKVDKADQVDSGKSFNLVDTNALIALKSKISSLEGIGGIRLTHPDITADGNLVVTKYPSGTFTTTDGTSVTVAKGQIVNMTR
jgi:hypothetical protein